MTLDFGALATISAPLITLFGGVWVSRRFESRPVAVHAMRGKVYGDYRAELENLLAEYRPEMEETRLTVIALTALIDGLWLELSLGEAPFTPDEAEALAARWLDALAG